MNTPADKQLLVLKANLFPDAETISQGITDFWAENKARFHDIQPANMNDADWDHVLDLVLSADLIITL